METHRENPVPEPCGSQGHLELSVGWVSPRVAVDQWLNSPGHRENLFRPQWRTVGIGILRGADFDRFDHGVIWVNQFGDG